MCPIVDAWRRYADEDVDGDDHPDAHQTVLRVLAECTPLNQEECRQRPNDPEDRAARPRSDGNRVEQVARHAPRQPRQNVDQGEPRMAVPSLHHLPKDEQRESVESQMHDTGVQERRAEEAPVFPLRYVRTEHGSKIE